MDETERLLELLEVGESLAKSIREKLNDRAHILLQVLPEDAEEFSTILPPSYDDGIDNDEKLFCFLSVTETSLSPAMKDKLKEHVKNLLDGLTPDVGEYLHTLDASDDTLDEDALRALIQACPLALLHKNKKGQIPVQHAVWDAEKEEMNSKAIAFIPVMAQMAVHFNVFDDEVLRGGLTGKKDDDFNVIANLAKGKDDESLRLGVYETLRNNGLLKKDDIAMFNLLKICDGSSPQIFQYLAKWDPMALKTYMEDAKTGEAQKVEGGEENVASGEVGLKREADMNGETNGDTKRKREGEL